MGPPQRLAVAVQIGLSYAADETFELDWGAWIGGAVYEGYGLSVAEEAWARL